MAADYETSQVFANNGDGTFTLTTDREVIIDQSGMGASVGDYDNDGDMDWFVTSIYQPPDFYGNRLYRNDGTGVFEDVTARGGCRRRRLGLGKLLRGHRQRRRPRHRARQRLAGR